MKLPKELINGFIIFIAIGAYFIIMEFLGVADLYFLRLFNILFVFYGTQKTLKTNFNEGNTVLASNASSALKTSLTGIFLSILGLISYSYLKGGDDYVKSLSKSFLFGGNPSVLNYSISLLFEGIVSAVIVTFILMLYWDIRYHTDKHGA